MAQQGLYTLPNYGNNTGAGFNLDNYYRAPQSQVTSQPSAFNTTTQNANITAAPGYGADSVAPPQKDGGFSFGDWAKVGQGVANTYLGAEALQLGKDQFGFAKDSFNTNLANQAQLINNEMESRQRARLETSGQYTGEGGQASLQSDLQSYLKPRQVSGEAI